MSAALPENAPEVAVWVSDLDGVTVVQIDTQPGAGRVRVNLNDAPIWGPDPDRGPKPEPIKPGDWVEMVTDDGTWIPGQVVRLAPGYGYSMEYQHDSPNGPYKMTMPPEGIRRQRQYLRD